MLHYLLLQSTTNALIGWASRPKLRAKSNNSRDQEQVSGSPVVVDEGEIANSWAEEIVFTSCWNIGVLSWLWEKNPWLKNKL